MSVLRIVILLVAMCTVVKAQHIVNNGLPVSNSAVVATNGDWITEGAFRNDGVIVTDQSFQNNGTLDAASTGGFVLKYETARTFAPGGRSFGFLRKEGAANLTLNTALQLRDSLSIQGGVIIPTNPADEITVSENGVVVTAPGSYLEGVLVRSGIGSLNFPIGKGGVYLPVTLVNASADGDVTVIIESAPTGFTPGPGVNDVIDFPYVWRVTKSNAADTAAFVELEYPEALTTASDIIVARKITGQDRYQGMGRRNLTTASGRTKIRSYSRGLQGTYTIARGFAGKLETDSLALVALFQQTGGSAWPNKTNWTTGRVNTWQGVTETGGQITAVNLPGNSITGEVPLQFADMAALSSVNLSGNQITRLPDLTGSTGLSALDVSNNKLGFGSLVPNRNIPGFVFANQALIDEPINTTTDVGSDFAISAITDGEGNVYQWKRNGTAVEGANNFTYTIVGINRTNMGDYVCEITNPAIPNFALSTANKRVLATASLSGQLLVSDVSGASQGKVQLFRITQTNGYDTIAVRDVNASGAYTFDKVVLDDYQILGFADTIAHEGALPTYYKNTIFWEEADTIRVEGNLAALNILSNFKPTEVEVGAGVISGFLEEPVDQTGRAKANKRVGGAGVAVRRVRTTSRPSDTVLELVAYVFTNEEGEFEIPELPVGEYRLNIQYPGYPMDESSFITIPIGQGLQSQVRVSALVDENKIAVTKLVVTGLYEQEGYKAQVFPNPAAVSLQVEFAGESAWREINLVDQAGREVHRQPATGKQAVVDVSGFEPGIYILQVSEGDQRRKAVRVAVIRD